MSHFFEIVTQKYQVEAKLWSGGVETKWEPKEGFFKQSADKIAKGLKRASKDLKQAMSRLNFYKNRAGKNLSAEDKKRLELAKDKLRNLYAATAAPIDEADMESDYADIYEIVGDYCNSAKFSSKIKEMKEEVLREISDKTKLKAHDEVRRSFDGVTQLDWLIEKMFGEYLTNTGKIES